MRLETLNAAIYEAERFLERARTLQRLAPPDRPWLFDHRKASGAVRRASMDLTRALTELRSPDA
jgi:hypothetical protein